MAKHDQEKVTTANAVIRKPVVIPAADAIRRMPSILDRKIQAFNRAVDQQITAIDIAPFSVVLDCREFGDTNEDVAFIREAGYEVTKSNGYWYVTFPEQPISETEKHTGCMHLVS